VVNAVGRGGAFEVDHNTGWLLSDDGVETELPVGPKSLLASHVWDGIAARLERFAPPSSAKLREAT
jgi:phosphopantothenoylcysteine decarboxylase/phosphopantothenate--cysteine ligase